MSTTASPLKIVDQPSDLLFPGALFPHVINVARRGPVLQPAPETGCKDVLGLNLTRGCFHRCAFCAVRGAPTYPGDEVIAMFGNIPDRLAAALAERPSKPRAVLVSPHVDPFPPQQEIQELTAQVVEALAGHGIEAWLMTRGFIRPAIVDLLAAHAKIVKVTIPITTMRRDLQRTLEQWTASPRLRLRQIKELLRRGIAVQVALEPLIPDLTDTTENLGPLLKALADVGVRHVTASYLFLREGIRDNLSKALGEPSAGLLDEAFANGPFLAPAGQGAAQFLPRGRRQRGYANLMALAANHGITVSVSRLSNPDFGPPTNPVRDATRKRLLPLFLEASKAQCNAEAN